MSTILITGANRGIGFELTRQMTERGESVIATCRAPAEAAELRSLADAHPTTLNIVQLTVTNPASIAAAKASVSQKAIDVLVNNAGIIGPKRQSTLDMDFDGWLETFDVNTLGPLRVLQAFLPNLERSAWPRVLTITSRMGSLTASPATDRIAYRASKAALNRTMLAVAGDLKSRNIAVAVAHPGWVQTDMGGQMAALTPAASAAGLIEVIDRMTLSNTPRFFDHDGSTISW
jgi:NAD(P)-dependent dehydrogenase (short-subunit alcohol dehydrogenase family)